MSIASNVILFLGIKNEKISNQRFHIPSRGIGEIEYDIEQKNWFKIEASKFNEDKAIPFLKLINDLVGAL